MTVQYFPSDAEPRDKVLSLNQTFTTLVSPPEDQQPLLKKAWKGQDVKMQKGLQEQIRALQEKIEERDVKHKAMQEKIEVLEAQLEKDGKDIGNIKATLSSIHLCALLDYSRRKIIEDLHCNTWELLRGDCNEDQFIDYIAQVLADRAHLSRDAIRFACVTNQVRRDGNLIAQKATKAQMREAVQGKKIGSNHRNSLSELFLYIWGEDVDVANESECDSETDSDTFLFLD